MSRLLCARLPRTLPSAGAAASLLSCRQRLLQPAARHSACPGGGNREEGEGAEGVPGSARGRLLRRAWGKSLSPLERVSRMIPPDLISGGGRDLQSPLLSNREGEEVIPPHHGRLEGKEEVIPPHHGRLEVIPPHHGRLEGKEEVILPHHGRLEGKEEVILPNPASRTGVHGRLEDVTPWQSSPSPPPWTLPSEVEDFGDLPPAQVKESGEKTSPSSPLSPPSYIAPEGDPSPPQGTPFRPGDLLLAEYKRGHHSMFRKMFLLTQHGSLVSNWGAIGSQDIVGKLPGQRLQSSTGHKILLRRPSLEEYVVSMRRGPNISYPKDIAAMMMAMDLCPGDVVLEAGSGSGAFSLFLSRAVGSDGSVYSFDIRADFHEVARKNFSAWRRAWKIRSGRTWPDNVRFINKNILEASPDIQSVAFDGAVLDMLNPQVALPVIVRNLKQGAICAVYIANITQVVDLLEGIRCCDLPLICEKIIEVGVTDWLVAPSVRKDGRFSRRVEPQAPDRLSQEEDDDDDDTDADDTGPARSEPFGQVPYIARPLPWQTGHTAFLVHLRKVNPEPPTDPEDSD